MRRRGRPQTEYKAIDKALGAFGGIESYLRKADKALVPYNEIATELEKITNVRVCTGTIRNWIGSLPAEEVAA